MGSTIDGSAVDKVLRDAVASGSVPHVAAIAADRDGIIYEGGAGVRVAGESGDPVGTSTQFRIMSMTKMICTVAALRQLEKGTLDLAAPVEEYCPDFADVQVLDGFDGDTPRLRAPASRATVRHLITHTSGLGYWFWNADIVRFEKATGIPNVVPGSAAALKAPMVADPGTAFVYGISTDWLGKVVEAIAGTTLDVVIRDGITAPLGMPDTMFRLDTDRANNCVPIHVKDPNGNWTSLGEILNQNPDWWSGGHGLYSTPRDYIRFQQALLRGGELDGERILTEDMVNAAFTNQIGDLDFPAEIPTADPLTSDTMHTGPGWKWGLRPTPQHGRPARQTQGRHRRVGGAHEHPLLRRPHHRHLRLALHQLPTIHRRERSMADLCGLRNRPLRGCPTAKVSVLNASFQTLNVRNEAFQASAG